MYKARNTMLKICGIRSVEEIDSLSDLAIDYFGCIFAPKSKRYVSASMARAIVERVHQAGKRAVGVFVDMPLDFIRQMVADTQIDIVQLHGSESPEYCKVLWQEGFTIWKAFGVWDTLPDISAYLDFIAYPLFDTKGAERGGNGISFSWELLKGISAGSFILAGGIDADNLEEALCYQPAILDVNSKVEVGHRKDRYLIERVIDKLEN